MRKPRPCHKLYRPNADHLRVPRAIRAPGPLFLLGGDMTAMFSGFGTVSLLGAAATIGASILIAELFGYLLHRLLHSERFPILSRAHLIHHLTLYGPRQPMRGPVYKNATEGRVAVGNIGMEWIAPVVLVLALVWSAMKLLNVPLPYEVLSLVTLLAWPVLMFSYLHDRMHIEGFWMARVPVLKTWFLRARRLHDIHHHSLNDSGRMDRNFGIGFFLFDRLFGTLARRHCALNRRGYHVALLRYQVLRRNDEDFSDFPSGYRTGGR